MARSLVYIHHKRKPRVGNVQTQNSEIMKKLFVFASLLFLGGMTAQAITIQNDLYGSVGNRYQNAQPITFKHKGVRFFVGTNGTLDFKIPGNQAYNRNRGTYGVSNHGSRYNNTTYGIKYDYNGNVIRIGNTLISYNRFGKVRKVGTIYMKYRNGKLSTLGGTQVHYDRYGNLYAINGYLTPYSDICATCTDYGCSFGYFNLAHYQSNQHDIHWNNHSQDYNDYTIRNRGRSRTRTSK